MAGEGDPSKGQQAEGESAGPRNKGGGTSLAGRLREASRQWFSRDNRDSLVQFKGEEPQVFQFLQQINSAGTLQDLRQILIAFRKLHGDYFSTPRFLSRDGTPKQYEIRELLDMIRMLSEGENIPHASIPRPIQDVCKRILAENSQQEAIRPANFLVCRDQSDHLQKIPHQITRIAQLFNGDQIIYGEGYENTTLISPERKAIDSDSIAKAVKVEGYYWIIPHRVAADRLPILIRVTEDEYRRLYDKLPPAYKNRG